MTDEERAELAALRAFLRDVDAAHPNQGNGPSCRLCTALRKVHDALRASPKPPDSQG